LKCWNQESSNFNEYFVFIEPVAKIPEGCPDTQAGNDFYCQSTSPRKEYCCEGIYNVIGKTGATNMAKQVDKNAVHSNDYKKPRSFYEKLFYVYQPIGQTKNKYGPPSTCKNK
jgi:hypothetical protein